MDQKQLDRAVLHDAVQVLFGGETLSKKLGTTEIGQDVEVDGVLYHLSVRISDNYNTQAPRTRARPLPGKKPVKKKRKP